jgi:hypothetical protein
MAKTGDAFEKAASSTLESYLKRIHHKGCKADMETVLFVSGIRGGLSLARRQVTMLDEILKTGFSAHHDYLVQKIDDFLPHYKDSPEYQPAGEAVWKYLNELHNLAVEIIGLPAASKEILKKQVIKSFEEFATDRLSLYLLNGSYYFIIQNRLNKTKYPTNLQEFLQRYDDIKL